MGAGRKMLIAAAAATSIAALLLSGAIAGFFYAYSVSVMRGFDAVAPAHAITAMQGINATIRNASFAPAFFGAPLTALAAALLLVTLRRRAAGIAMLAAVLVYVLGAFWPTFAINVPMNEALAGIEPDSADAAQNWAGYAARWTWWNGVRATASFGSLLLVGLALFLSGRRA